MLPKKTICCSVSFFCLFYSVNLQDVYYYSLNLLRFSDLIAIIPRPRILTRIVCQNRYKFARGAWKSVLFKQGHNYRIVSLHGISELFVQQRSIRINHVLQRTTGRCSRETRRNDSRSRERERDVNTYLNICRARGRAGRKNEKICRIRGTSLRKNIGQTLNFA